MVSVSIFLLCYNESVLLPHTVNHYKRYLPNCHITIYDNESTDNSVELAKSLGCSVVSWSSKNINNVHLKQNIVNNAWKEVESGWIIVADMDEWLCVTETDLEEEEQEGTTLLQVKGLQMVGTSESITLEDIDLHSIQKYQEYTMESKSLCFLRDSIYTMKYEPGAHHCKPEGILQYSQKVYLNKHMAYLGLPFIVNKMKQRYQRSAEMRLQGMSIHYTNDVERITKDYTTLLENSTTALFS